MKAWCMCWQWCLDLPEGSRGMSWRELDDAEPDDPRAVGTLTREQAVHTFGNLTILT